MFSLTVAFCLGKRSYRIKTKRVDFSTLPTGILPIPKIVARASEVFL